MYDVPELIDEGKAPQVFKHTPSGPELDIKSKRLAEGHGTPAKNKKGDLPTILLTPEEGGFDPQSLAMTRSIGDLYMQSFGVSWEPEAIAVDLQEECTELSHLTLIMASDGLWDLFETEEVFDGIVAPPPQGEPQSTETAAAFFERSLDAGDEIFGEHTDNITQATSRRAAFRARGSPLPSAAPPCQVSPTKASCG